MQVMDDVPAMIICLSMSVSIPLSVLLLQILSLLLPDALMDVVQRRRMECRVVAIGIQYNAPCLISNLNIKENVNRSQIINDLYKSQIIKYTNQMDWNQYSDDSWMGDASDSDKEQATKKQTGEHSKGASQDNQANQDTQITKKQSVSATTQNKGQGEKTQQNKERNKINKTYSKKESSKFLTDKEVLEQYETAKVEEDRKIKVINCNEKQQKQMLQERDKNKLFRLKEYKPGCYVVSCWNKEDLIKFIKQKIEKNYKFKIGVYVPSEKQKQMKAIREKQRAEKQKERAERKNKQQKQPKQHREHRGERQHRDRNKVQYKAKHEQNQERKQSKKDYRREKDDEQDKKQRKQHKDQPKQQRESRYKDKDEPKQAKNKERDNKGEQNKDNRDKQGKIKKEYSKQQDRKYKHKGGDQDHGHDKKQRHEKKQKIQAKDIQREGKSSNISVKTSEISPENVADWVKQQKLDKQFNMITLVAKGNLYQYVQKICQECFKLFKFGLSSEILQEECQQKPNEIFKFVLKQVANPVPIKKSIQAIFVSKSSQQSFEQIEKFNTHIIGNKKNLQEEVDFDQKQYFELFKKNYQKIVAKWSKWVIYAYGKNIAKLLKLSGEIKKKLSKNEFNYEVGVQDKLPFLRFQICDLNKTKYKVDTSVINSHLQDS